MSDDKKITTSFPEPGDEIELSKLITTVYLNDKAVTEPEPEVRYNIVYDDNSLDLNLPEEETPYVKEGVSYDYSQSTYDNSITTGGAVKLTVGEHYLNHYYYDASTRGAIVYHANGGSFSDGSTDVARSAFKTGRIYALDKRWSGCETEETAYVATSCGGRQSGRCHGWLVIGKYSRESIW